MARNGNQGEKKKRDGEARKIETRREVKIREDSRRRTK